MAIITYAAREKLSTANAYSIASGIVLRRQQIDGRNALSPEAWAQFTKLVGEVTVGIALINLAGPAGNHSTDYLCVAKLACRELAEQSPVPATGSALLHFDTHFEDIIRPPASEAEELFARDEFRVYEDATCGWQEEAPEFLEQLARDYPFLELYA